MPGLNSAQISDRAKSMGYNLSDGDVQNVLKSTFDQSQYGADEGKVLSYLQSNYGNKGGSPTMGGGQSNTQKLQDMFGAQRSENSNFLDRYKQAISSMPNMADRAGALSGELGLDKLRANAQGLNNTLFNIPGVQTKATTGFGVNANQLSRIIGQKQSEIAPSAALASANAQAGEANLNTRLGYEREDQARSLMPYQMEREMMRDQQARESTGYPMAMQNELDMIIEKMRSGAAVTEADKQRAHELAVREIDFKNAQQTERLRSSLNPSYMSVNKGETIINPATGKVVYGNAASMGGNVASVLGPPRSGAGSVVKPPTMSGGNVLGRSIGGLLKPSGSVAADKPALPKTPPGYAKPVSGSIKKS